MADDENPVPESDSALRTLAYLVETGDDGFGMDVVLSVSGSVLAGRLVPSTVWMRRFGIYDRMADAREAEIAEHRAARAAGETSGAGAVGPMLPNFIHLENVTHLSGTVPAGGDAVWRYRVSEVSGWTIGSLAAS